MKEIIFLPHTADVRMEIRADELPELFEAGVEGLAALLQPSLSSPLEANWDLVMPITVSAPDITLLLLDVLSEVLTHSNIEKAVFLKLDVLNMSEMMFKGRIFGLYTSGFEEDVKAVTYTEANIRKDDAGKWLTQIVFDI
jgi:SHS2 domain-containing protein